MKKAILLFALVLSPVAAWAAAAQVRLDHANVDLGDTPSLQRGARIFVNYCLSCHSAAYMRYNRMGHDLGLSDELVKENLLFAADKVGDLMKAVMPADDAKAVFGVVPPDLTVIARARGADWLYTYMRSFYRDEKSYSGWNNTVFPHVAMPHVLYEWQGQQRAVFDKDGKFERFELERPGRMSAKDYDAAMRDLTNFLVYMGEPAKLVRYRLGVFVIGFLILLLIFAYLLKKEYWKDVH
jgi:ubiquinol-cytochrome c reductase cytochrome c1 subunit